MEYLIVISSDKNLINVKLTLMRLYNITQSMSRKGYPYDNALAENFFSAINISIVKRSNLFLRLVFLMIILGFTTTKGFS